MSGLKIGVIGSGSTYAPELIDGFIKRRDFLQVDEIVMMDIDPERLEITGKLAQRMVQRAGMSTKIILTTDRKQALTERDFVVTQIRVGLMEGRARDERIPLEFGIIGQETTGPGGFSMALRTIPVMVEMAREMAELSPNGWMINFTNPSGLIAEAVNRHSKARSIGLCNVPITLQSRLAELLNVDRDQIVMDYFGLNHLTWIRKVFLDGKDVTRKVMDEILYGKESELSGYAFNKKMVEALGMIPGGYLQYYYHRDKILEKLLSSPGRAEVVMKIDRELLDLYSDPDLNEKPLILEQRGGAWYSDAAVALISAISNDKKETHIVNVRNNGSLLGLESDVVVEVPAYIDSAGAHPVTLGEVPLSIKGLIQIVKNYELLTVEAAIEGSYGKALLALANHPLVTNVDVAEKLLDRILEENKAYLPLFTK